jgi:integrase
MNPRRREIPTMPKPRDPYWHGRDKAYKTRINGREKILRNLDGTKVAHNDDAGIRAAVARLLAENDALIKRVLDPTVEDVCRDYLIACAAESTAETVYGKEWILTKFCAFGNPLYGNRAARQIDSGDLHRMRKSWEKEGYSGGMLRRLYREVMACWAWAARPEPERLPKVILDKNPLDGMRLPAGSEKSAKYIPLAVIRTLIIFAETRAERMGPLRCRFEKNAVLMLRLLAETGCRPKEACEARWEEFDEEAMEIRLNRHKTAKKTGKVRVIVLPVAIATELIALRNSGHAHPTHMFAHARSRGSIGADRETGAPWRRPGYTSWFCRLVRAARKVGYDLPRGLTLYWLRHSYLTDAQMSLNSEKAANLAGNKKEMARGTYLHVQSQELRNDSEQVARHREGK